MHLYRHDEEYSGCRSFLKSLFHIAAVHRIKTTGSKPAGSFAPATERDEAPKSSSEPSDSADSATPYAELTLFGRPFPAEAAARPTSALSESLLLPEASFLLQSALGGNPAVVEAVRSATEALRARTAAAAADVDAVDGSGVPRVQAHPSGSPPAVPPSPAPTAHGTGGNALWSGAEPRAGLPQLRASDVGPSERPRPGRPPAGQPEQTAAKFKQISEDNTTSFRVASLASAAQASRQQQLVHIAMLAQQVVHTRLQHAELAQSAAAQQAANHETRLARLQQALTSGLLTGDDAAAARKEILADLRRQQQPARQQQQSLANDPGAAGAAVSAALAAADASIAAAVAALGAEPVRGILPISGAMMPLYRVMQIPCVMSFLSVFAVDS